MEEYQDNTQIETKFFEELAKLQESKKVSQQKYKELKDVILQRINRKGQWNFLLERLQ